MRGRRFEVHTAGFDPDLQLIGADPSGGPYTMGMRVPATSNGVRYMGVLCGLHVNARERLRLVEMRQFLSIGCYMTNASQSTLYPLVRPIETPNWHFTDAAPSWHLRRVSPFRGSTASPLNTENRQFRYGIAPAFLFETLAGDGGPLPPYGGLPPGRALEGAANLSTFGDIRGTWNRPMKMNVPIEGPCDILFIISIPQTIVANRTKLVATPAGTYPGPLVTTGVTPEDAFTYWYDPSVNANSSGPIYWNVAGAMTFAREDGDVIGARTPKYTKERS